MFGHLGQFLSVAFFRLFRDHFRHVTFALAHRLLPPTLVRTNVLWVEENSRPGKWAFLNPLEIEDDSWSNFDEFWIKLVLLDLVFALENNLIVSYPDAAVLQGEIEDVVDEGLRLWVVTRSTETLSEQLFDQRPMRS